MKKILVSICVLIIALIVVAVLAVHFFLDGAVKKGVETVGSKMTRVDVKLDGVHISLLSGAGKITGLVVGNPDGFKTPHAISVGTAALALKPGSLLADKIVISSINVDSPEITIEGLPNNNLKKIQSNLNETTSSNGPGGSNTVAGATPKEEKKANKKLEVDDFQITNAKLSVSISGVEKSLTLPTIHFSNLGTGPDGITAAELTKKVIDAIEDAAEKEVASNYGDLAKDAAANLTKGLGKDVSGSLTNVTKSIGNLLKKQ
jgi:hypothetical protein